MNRVENTRIGNGNTKLLGNTKYNQVKSVLAVFASDFSYQVSIKLY